MDFVVAKEYKCKLNFLYADNKIAGLILVFSTRHVNMPI